MIAIIDYNAGNLRSVEKAFAAIGEQTEITRDFRVIEAAERVVLPGVGAFGDAMGQLRKYGLDGVIRETAASGRPFLGICLGLQMLFSGSEECPDAEGLGILKGSVVRIPPANGLKIPHIGWNSLKLQEGSRLFAGIKDGSHVYFVHSYYLKAEDADIVSASTEYGVTIHAAVEQGNVSACQFHPEKSGAVGLAILKNFAAM